MEALSSLKDVGNGKVHSTTLVEREKKVYSIQVGTFDNKNPEVDTL